MENITTAMTAPAHPAAPAIGMPAYQSTARTAGVSTCVRATGASWTERVRNAGIAVPAAIRGALVATAAVITDAVKGGAFPGPDAWSPPIT